jgi:hypothetical protein
MPPSTRETKSDGSDQCPFFVLEPTPQQDVLDRYRRKDAVMDPRVFRDPAELRDALELQEIARRTLPCVSSTSRYWRYYLFLRPAPGRQDRGARLVEVLEQTEGKRSGLGRQIFIKARKNTKELKKLKRRLNGLLATMYGTAA